MACQREDPTDTKYPPSGCRISQPSATVAACAAQYRLPGGGAALIEGEHRRKEETHRAARAVKDQDSDQWTHALEEKPYEIHVLRERVQELGKDVIVLRECSERVKTLEQARIGPAYATSRRTDRHRSSSTLNTIALLQRRHCAYVRCIIS